jgi:formate dehydrogenase gamma subunit
MKWVQRFNLAERILHWINAILVLTLLITGVSLYADGLREQLGSLRFHVRTLHHYAGLALMVIPPLFITIFFPALKPFLREMTHWRAGDVEWLTGKSKVAHKFNGGQKLNFLFTLIWLMGLAVTGFLIWKQPFITQQIREFLYSWHRLLFWLMSIQLMGHLYLSVLHPATRHAFKGIIRGKVKRSWAKTHHSLWLEEVEKNDATTDSHR